MTRAGPALVAAIFCLAAAPADTPGPSYTAQGNLCFPASYRDWTFLSSGIDMRYSARPAMSGGAHVFDNVFVQPWAVAAFRHTGHWPEGTMLVLENRGGTGTGSINRHGVFQTGDVMGLEVHVHDSAHLPGGWGFFSFDGNAPAPVTPRGASCYACHQAHGAVDTTFVQFYPTLGPIAKALGTYRATSPLSGK